MLYKLLNVIIVQISFNVIASCNTWYLHENSRQLCEVLSWEGTLYFCEFMLAIKFLHNLFSNHNSIDWFSLENWAKMFCTYVITFCGISVIVQALIETITQELEIQILQLWNHFWLDQSSCIGSESIKDSIKDWNALQLHSCKAPSKSQIKFWGVL